MRIRALSAKIATESSLPISVQSLETAWALSDRNNVSGEGKNALEKGGEISYEK